MIKRYFIYSTCYFILLLAVGEDEGVHLTFNSIRSLIIPYNQETQGISVFLLVLNLGLVLLFVDVIIKGTDDFFTLSPYALTRAGKVYFFFLYIKQIGRMLVIVIAAKLIIDMVIALPDFNQLTAVFAFAISTILTVFFLTMSVFLMRLKGLELQLIYFLLLLLTLTTQILSFSIEFFGIFVIASLGFLDNFWIIISGKIVLCLILILINYVSIRKYESLGS
ncbi:hypothetical protein J2T56_000707 [Natronobacillus azotifigens]|uniref:Uncharacterized protein n=1 Tax=Natronobacillus azotifigens TaxID=472978 RepID=A0A9J6R9A8_9BACI|nr:hypothetical protein [Natronobacillus azotifigens]MCZ0702258.1 hypothetical protein [Natronobacillus azotifigens]